MRRKATIVTVAVVSGLLSAFSGLSTAHAQEWLKDRRYQEGIGIRTGDLELHPGLAGEIGYDSNWFLRTNREGPNITNGAPRAPVLGAGVLRITPSLSISTLSPQRRQEAPDVEPPKVMFRAGLSATYREFFGDEDVRRQRNISGGANARVDILPQRTLGGALFASYLRTVQPNVVSANPDLSFTRNDIGAGGEIITQPGGGTLDWHFGYQYHTTLFEQDVGQQFNNYIHEAFTKGRWKFRPRTALVYDGTLRFLRYSNRPTLFGSLADSDPVRARIGLSGLVTPRFSFLGMVGWGASFYDTSNDPRLQQFDSVIAQAEAKFFISGNPDADQPESMSLLLSSIALGYMRDFQNSYLANFYGYDRGYAKIVYFFAGRALLSLEGGVAALQYPDMFFPSGNLRQQGWTDVRADGTLFGEYRFADSLGVNATLRYTANFSETQIRLTETGPNAADVFDMNFRRVEAFLGLRWFM